MTFDEFRASIADDEPPADLNGYQRALWEDARGNWAAAHELVQDETTTEAAWIHAYLHRKEGDLANAGYWYRRCEMPVCEDPLEVEWERIVRAILE